MNRFLQYGAILAVLLFGTAQAEPQVEVQAQAKEEQAKVEAQAEVQDDPRANYQQVELSGLVPASRMPDGSRAIFVPNAVHFKARLQKMPEPQKSDYLKRVMDMMGITSIGQVNQRVVLDYGGDKPLAAYVEDKAALRMSQELKRGGEHEFYAFHVYNNRHGPALVIVSFDKGK